MAGISDATLDQIRDIVAQKRQFTPDQRKIDSALMFTAKAIRGEFAGRAYERAAQAVPVDQGGNVVVNITGSVPEIATLVTAAGGQVLAQHLTHGMVRARLPLLNLERVAQSPSVKFIYRPLKPIRHVGAVTSQGYVSHAANAVAGMRITGAGVKVGVLSDSASAAGLAGLVRSGDLDSNTTVLMGQDGPDAADGGTDEGLALMEIIHDLAPGAQLFFATAGEDQATMAENIAALASAGCTILVDDVSFPDETAFEDGTVAAAVDAFVQSGGLYLSAAGNDGNHTNSTSSVWEGSFYYPQPLSTPLGRSLAGPIAYLQSLPPESIVNFDFNYVPLPPQGNDTPYGPDPAGFHNSINPGPDGVMVFQWSEPTDSSSADYDVFVLDSTTSQIKAIAGQLPGTPENPVEAVAPVDGGISCGGEYPIGYCPAVGDWVVVLSAGAELSPARIDTFGGSLNFSTAGSIAGHAGAASAITVAATHWDSARTGTKAFTGAPNATEVFDSDGPRKIYYNPDGSPIPGGKVLQKPDLTAADGVSVHTPGFTPFFGTSAAAAHAAGVAALVASANPNLTNTQIRSILVNTALDDMSPGWDRDGGFGVVMALPAVQAALATK